MASFLGEELRCNKRLMSDLRDLMKEPLPTAVAAPLEENIRLWHCNLRPVDGAFSGSVFHLRLRFPRRYPMEPPDVQLLSTNLPGHPNVFGEYICLSMLKPAASTAPYDGWSSAYTVKSILLQLQSFLLTEGEIDQDHGGTSRARWTTQYVDYVKQQNSAFVLKIDDTVTHTHAKPFPAFREVLKGPVSHRTPASSGAISKVNWVRLPEAVVAFAAAFLTTEELPVLRRVCKDWEQIDNDFNLFERRQLCCFHTKVSIDDDESALFGIGLSLRMHHDGQRIASVTSPLDVLSEAAFVQDHVRLSVWKHSFDHFLPLAINQQHFHRAIPRLRKAICAIFPTDNSPMRLLDLFCAAMNTMVVQLFHTHNWDNSSGGSPELHASELAIDGYVNFHHLLLRCSIHFPQIRAEAQRRVTAFIGSDEHRHKDHCPDLGRFLVCLTLSREGWEEIKYAYLKESFARQVRWLLKKMPRLEITTPPHCADPLRRQQQTLEAASTGLRLTCFQVAFLDIAGRPAGTAGPEDVAAAYDKRLGKPTVLQRRQLQSRAKGILALRSWPEFFQLTRAPVAGSKQLHGLLVQSIAASAEKGYHHGRRGGKGGGKGGGGGMGGGKSGGKGGGKGRAHGGGEKGAGHGQGRQIGRRRW